MAGCDTHNVTGNYYWSRERVGLGWGGLGATVGAAAALTALAAFNGWVLLLGAAGGYLIGFSIGYAYEWFNRLYEQNPKTIAIEGRVACAGRNNGYPGAPIFSDGDWTFNVAELAVTAPGGLSVAEVRTRPAPDWGEPTAHEVTDPDTGLHILHCEIGSSIGDAVAISHMVGTIGGAITGAIIGAAIGCFVLAIFTFGLGCLIAILVGILLGALAGGVVGDLAGWAIGAIADAVNDFDGKGQAVAQGCMVHFEGTWVTDASHQHNEIHDIKSMQILGCSEVGSTSGELVAATVGIGRHPTGIDP